jgi:dihydroorotate dehydrogenase (fumarate)
MVDLRTNYLGLDLKSPLIAAASPLSEKVESVQKMEENGLAAVVMYSLFEEQIVHESLELDHFLNTGTYTYAESLTFLPRMGRYSVGPDVYINHLSKIKEAVRIPVIGSLNGVSPGGWTEYARKIEQAGADALELNIYYLSLEPDITSSELEDNYTRLVSDVCQKVSIPVGVKLSPYFTSLPNLSRRLVEAGAKGLVFFNRFYQPDFDLNELKVVPNLELSTSQELRLPLRWIALMYGMINADFALTSGVHTGRDVLKAIMAGSSAVMLASSLLKNGIGHAAKMLAEVQEWMEENEYDSIEQMKGSMSARAIGEVKVLKRANYMKELSSFSYLP